MKPNQPGSPRKITCPRCGEATIWHESNPYRPFCSERCKLIDLGQWATEGYRIPQAEDDAIKPDEA
ncbi:MAG: DNA gyrase inhibitor YacG [Burkholderiales bacterium]